MFNMKHRFFEEMAEGGEGEASAASEEATEESNGEVESKPEEGSLLDNDVADLTESEFFKKEKFKTPEQQLKAYIEAEKRLGGFKGAPEEYKLPDNVAEDDELAKVLVERAKKHNASQEVLDDMLEVVNTYVDQSSQVSAEAEREKLGSDADKRLERLDNQLKNKFEGEKYKKMAGLFTTAESVMIAEMLLGDSANLPVEESGGSSLTWGDIEKELTKKDDKGRYLASYDVNHFKKIEKMKKEYEKQQA